MRVWWVFRVIFVLLGSAPLCASPVHQMLESEFHHLLFFRGAHFPDEHLVHGRADFAIYDGIGTWDASKEGLKRFLIDHQLGYRTVTAQEIRADVLNRDGYRVLVMPGGESWQFLEALSDAGAEKIRAFVASGGGYFGVCAGAFFATSHRQGGGIDGPYGIGLLHGTAYDGTSMEIEPFREGAMSFRAGGEGMALGWNQRNYLWLMLGGPSLRFTPEEAKEKHIRVLARIPGLHEPALIVFEYGLGRVFLSAPHIEVEPTTVDSLDLEAPVHDSGGRVLETVVDYLLRKY